MSKTNYMEKQIDNDKMRRDMIVGKVAAHLFIKELKFSVEQSRVVTTLDLFKH